jgi:prevent-host-death family protein
MNTAAETPRYASLRDLPTVSASALKNTVGDVFKKLRAASAVVIKRHDKPHAVLLSVEEYDRLSAYKSESLSGLFNDYHQQFATADPAKMQNAWDRLMKATPEELGENAVRAAQIEKVARE